MYGVLELSLEEMPSIPVPTEQSQMVSVVEPSPQNHNNITIQEESYPESIAMTQRQDSKAYIEN